MLQKHKNNANSGSKADPNYTRGDYFADPLRHSKYAKSNSNNFLKIFLKFAKHNKLMIRSYIDVGCGSGDTVKIVAESLKENDLALVKVRGYDVSPHVKNIKNEGVEYIHGDFCESDEFVDLVTLFDVIEHVPDPINFIKLVSQRCKIMGLHIPLDYSLSLAMRNKFRSKLRKPGHLIFLDCVSALNLLTFAGLRVIDYKYTFRFFPRLGQRAPFSRILFPFRYVLAKINPYLYSKMFGRANLVVIAITPNGREIEWQRD